MPTPVGHALAGVAVGCLITVGSRIGTKPVSCRKPSSLDVFSTWWLPIYVFAFLGMLPDLDFLAGIHSTYTHSLGAATVVGIASAFLINTKRLRTAFALSAAYGSHVLLDWLGTDTVAPKGIMALWPLSQKYFLSEQQWFDYVCREYWLGECWGHNIKAVGWEIAILAPAAVAMAYLVRSRIAAEPQA